MDDDAALLSTEALHATWLQALDARSKDHEQQFTQLRLCVAIIMLTLIAVSFYRLGKGRLAP